MKDAETASLGIEKSPSGMALLIMDMISTWRFPDAEKLLPPASAIAASIESLKRRCRSAAVPVIYANDNRGRWRSDFREAVESSLAEGGKGAEITQRLMPDHDDYFVLKPMHSAFFATPLKLLLDDLQVQRLIVTGTTTDQCVLVTASDARMRGVEVMVPRDCVATLSRERQERAIQHLNDVLCVRTPLSTALRVDGSDRPVAAEQSA